VGWVGVTDGCFGGLFLSVGVDVDAFDGSWAGAVPAGRVESLEDFSAGCVKSVCEALRGKSPPGR
jgi:hypothetical protein